MLTGLTDAFLNLVYPQNCRICSECVEQSADGIACKACWSDTRILSKIHVLCKKCGAFLRESEQPVETLCRQCDDHLYDSARAVGVYENALAATVVQLKHTPHIPRTLIRFLHDTLEQTAFGDATLIVPVPLSAKRLKERGFNQAEVIAKVIAGKKRIPLDSYSLARRLHTPMHRVAMDKKAREMTVRKAFEVKRPNLVAGHNILLIDDVFTSGSTVSYCAKALKKSGAAKVNVLTLARAV